MTISNSDPINKSLLHEHIIIELTRLHAFAQSATQTAIDTATDQENVPEHKYDTLSLEAAYLAHGQAQRLQQCAEDIQTFNALPIKEFVDEDKCSLGALVEVLDESDNYKWFFISPVAGGLKLQFLDHLIQLVTPQSPLGQALLKNGLGDEFEMVIGDTVKTYEVVTLL